MKSLAIADLHVHTNASDGAYSVREVAELAAKAGLEIIAVTDHDTIAGFDSAPEKAAVEVIRGLELSTQLEDREAHILGYFVDTESAALRRQLHLIQRKRRARIHSMVRKLAGQKIDITAPQVFELSGDGSVGRLHLAELLIDHGHSANVYEAFRDFLGPEGSAFVPRPRLSAAEAIRIIHEAGGAAVLAHPRSNFSFEEIEGFADAGLDGIEAHYARHSLEQVEFALEAAGKLDLVATGGSDFHGRRCIQTAIGAARVSRETVRELEERSRKYAAKRNAREA